MGHLFICGEKSQGMLICLLTISATCGLCHRLVSPASCRLTSSSPSSTHLAKWFAAEFGQKTTNHTPSPSMILSSARSMYLEKSGWSRLLKKRLFWGKINLLVEVKITAPNMLLLFFRAVSSALLELTNWWFLYNSVEFNSTDLYHWSRLGSLL